jgi:NAD-dependent SIR2 family protein deacetylase
MTIKFQDGLSHWLPNELINAQKNGELLLFCGAGVSMTAELPSFRELVDNIAISLFDLKDNNKDDPSYISCVGKEDCEFTKLMKDKQYDKAIFYLENKSPGFKRKHLIEHLKKEFLKEKPILHNHEIILELASSIKGTRLVTTNFDNLFENARGMLTNRDNIKVYDAPLIPLANPERWSGIVKIHGSLDTNNKKHSDDIVISSGDFGRAYLTERWASQFIIDMFKYFHVLFIGYSISDPIFRYIIDAIAIDKRSNLNLKTSYILLREAKNDNNLKKNYEDVASSYNGLTKIFYKHTGDDKDHSDLYKKLQEWLK